jgi:hypothetical protein
VRAICVPLDAKKSAPTSRSASESESISGAFGCILALSLLLRLQSIQSQCQPRLIPVRRILRQSPLPNRLIQIRKSRRSQLLRCSRIARRQSRPHPPYRSPHPRAIHAIDRRAMRRLPDILQYRFRLLLMLDRRALSHSVLLRGLFRIIENIRRARSCQFRRDQHSTETFSTGARTLR